MSFTYTCDYCGEQIDGTIATIEVRFPLFTGLGNESGWLGHYHDNPCYPHVRDAITACELPGVRALESIPTLSGQAAAARKRRNRRSVDPGD